MASLRSAAVLALSLKLAFAEPGNLRGQGANATREAPAEAAQAALLGVVNGTVNATARTDAATAEVTEAPLAAAEAIIANASNAWMAAEALAMADVSSMAAVSNMEWYYDGQCTPCPAYLYSHCSRGGRLVGRRRCGMGGAYCEGLCQKWDADPAPTAPPTPQPTQPPVGTTGAPAQGGIMTLYHETSPQIAELILANGFRPGSSGWCGGAIYFFSSPNIPRTKLGPDSHHGAVIEAKVDMGRMASLDRQCHGASQAKQNYDSITFNPGDGAEFLVFSKDRIISTRRYS